MHTRDLFGKTPDNAPAPSPNRIVSRCVLCLGCALCSGCVSCPWCASRAAATRSAAPPKAGMLSESVAGRDRRGSFPRAAMPNRQCLATPAHTHQQRWLYALRRDNATTGVEAPLWKGQTGQTHPPSPGAFASHRRFQAPSSRTPDAPDAICL